MKKRNLLLLIVLIAAGSKASAQDWKSDERINLLFGLSQPILASGFTLSTCLAIRETASHG